MGLVFLAEDMHLRRPVALKVLKPEKAKDFVARQRFLRKARAMAALNSDHIITIYEVGQANDIPFFAMGLLQGEPLNVWLARQLEPTVDQVLELALQLTAGLNGPQDRPHSSRHQAWQHLAGSIDLANQDSRFRAGPACPGQGGADPGR